MKSFILIFIAVSLVVVFEISNQRAIAAPAPDFWDVLFWSPWDKKTQKVLFEAAVGTAKDGNEANKWNDWQQQSQNINLGR